MTPPVLDLLRERREELGIGTLSGTLAQRNGLLQRGVLIGASILGVMVGLVALLFLQQQLVRAHMGQLEQFEAQANSLRADLGARKARVDKLDATNRQLSAALTSVRTTSALLADLQLRTPDGVQLLSAQANGPTLLLKGVARDPMAFARINALQLQLQRSPLLQGDAITLTKVERVPQKDQPPADPKNPLPPRPLPVAFELSGPFATLPPARQLEVLRSLGSEGMARRLQLLRTEGLMP